jgi:tetratricopeptide (TPR) repeat protein
VIQGASLFRIHFMSQRQAAKGMVSAAALLGEELAPTPVRPLPASGTSGHAGSAAALARLDAAMKELKALAVRPLLQRGVQALQADDDQAAAEWALKALNHDERSGHGWYILAIAREKVGDFKGSLKCYEAALQLLPDEMEVANDLGRLAYKLGMKPIAEQLFARYLLANPDSVDAANNLACAVRDQMRYDEAIEILKGAIQANLDNGMLWNTLGTVVSERGDFETAATFYTEALRCEPGLFRAQYNRGNALLPLGRVAEAIEDCETALRSVRAPDERAMMTLARSTMLLNLGRIGEGWDAYEARLDPQFADVTHFMIDRPRWTPETDIEGRTLLLMGEQGLGDEVLFGTMLPDVLQALGPSGKLYLALEKRLVPLFQRAFPDAVVGAHATYKVDGHTVRGAPFVKDQAVIDLWAPLASPLRRFRRTLEDYPDRRAVLAPDPVRVAHWRAQLAGIGGGPKVGVLWKSLKLEGARARYFSPFHQWAPVLGTPGAAFVNMQYGDCAEEIAQARAELGVEIWQPPGIDLKNDLDDVAALSCALDLLVGPANATSNIAAACGAPVWIISTPGAWPKLGTRRYPWYPSVRVFDPPAFNDWDPVMAELSAALAEVLPDLGT